MPLSLLLLISLLPGPGCDPLAIGAMVDRPIRRLNAPAPPLPEALRGTGFRGRVIVQFVVCDDGSVDTTSIRIMRSDDRRLEAGALAAARRLRFAPARLRGRPVAQLVQQAFRFHDRQAVAT